MLCKWSDVAVNAGHDALHNAFAVVAAKYKASDCHHVAFAVGETEVEARPVATFAACIIAEVECLMAKSFRVLYPKW